LDPTATAAFAPAGVFQSIEFETNATTGMGNWTKAKRKLSAEAASYAACDTGTAKCPTQLRSWRAKLSQWKSLSTQAKLLHVNQFANAAIGYTDDRKVFRTADHWATPLESLKGRGDCEDYVLLKYASLRSLGFSEDQLRIVIVNDLKAGVGHAVLSVRLGKENYILDNQDNRVLRHDSIQRYAPVYSVNAKGRWINIATRDLKKRKAADVVLVASLEDTTVTNDVSPSQTRVIPLPVLRVEKLAPATQPLPAIMTSRLQAVASVALLKPAASVVLAQTTATSKTDLQINPPSMIANVLRPILAFAERLALI
jgi:predicted transglutaminase-like cysteine proteinase